MVFGPTSCLHFDLGLSALVDHAALLMVTRWKTHIWTIGNERQRTIIIQVIRPLDSRNYEIVTESVYTSAVRIHIIHSSVDYRLFDVLFSQKEC